MKDKLMLSGTADVVFRLEVGSSCRSSGTAARSGGMAVADHGETETIPGIDIFIWYFYVQYPAVGKFDCFD